MPSALVEPIFNVLVAQAKNLARIETGLVLQGTTGTGDNIELWGPQPNFVRLYDEPLRLVQAMRLSNWQRIITLLPIDTKPKVDARMGMDSARIMRRADKSFAYQIQFLVRLTDSEMTQDRANILQPGAAFRESNLLAEKMHKLLYDFHHVFSDNDHLQTDDCPGGLVNAQEYDLVWDDAAEYPMALAHAIVMAELSAWG